MRRKTCLVAALAASALLSAPAQARITDLQILRVEPAFGGQPFGSAGAYEHVFARAYGELDPADPHNAIIQDINLAPKDRQGLVHYSTDVEFLRPLDPSRTNHVLLFEVNNRGNKLAVAAFNAGVPPGVQDRNALTTAGDGWLMDQGYTLGLVGMGDGCPARVEPRPHARDRRPQSQRRTDQRHRAQRNHYPAAYADPADQPQRADPGLPVRQLRFLSGDVTRATVPPRTVSRPP